MPCIRAAPGLLFYQAMEPSLARATALLLVVLSASCGGENAEGRPWVRNVTFEGVSSLRRRDLARRLAVERTPWLRFPKRYLDPLTVPIDADRIEAYYRAHGFFDARVVTAEIIPWRGPKDKPGAVDVRFVVDEGAPTQVSDVEVSGLEAQPRLEHETRLRLRMGERFDHAAYLAARDAIGERLLAGGHPWPEVSGRIEVWRRNLEAKIHLAVDPGPLGRIARVSVDGLPRSAWRLVRYSGLREGARFDPERLDEARARVENLGLFSTVWLDYEHGDQPEDVNVVVHVRERSRNELRLGGGLGFDAYRSELHASAFYTRRHWLGGLRTLELKLQPGWVAVPAFWEIERTGPSLQAEATLTQPDWPIPRGQLRLSLAYDVGVEYAYQFHGPRTGVRLERGLWRDRLRLGVSYDFELLQFFNTDPVILDNPQLAGRLFGYTNPYRLGWLQQNAALDLRDAPLEAHRGFYVSLLAEEGGPFAGGAFLYQKLQPDVRGYAPLGSHVTLAGRFWFGQLFSQGDLGSPITRRFYLGGANSHRGFNYDRLSPQVPSGISGMSPIPIGGDQMVLASFELRVKTFRIAGQWLSLATFADGGDVGGPSCATTVTHHCTSVSRRTSVDWGDLNWAVGGGLRYRTVIGTVRADLGVRLNRLSATQSDGTPNPDPGDRYAFHLSLGEAF
jgi:outer membrane protein assembly factor BamA